MVVGVSDHNWYSNWNVLHLNVLSKVSWIAILIDHSSWWVVQINMLGILLVINNWLWLLSSVLCLNRTFKLLESDNFWVMFIDLLINHHLKFEYRFTGLVICWTAFNLLLCWVFLLETHFLIRKIETTAKMIQNTICPTGFLFQDFLWCFWLEQWELSSVLSWSS